MLAMSITKDEVSHLICYKRSQVRRIKWSNEDTADLQMREIKKLKHSEPPSSNRRKANEDQYKFNLKFEETARQRPGRWANVPACIS